MAFGFQERKLFLVQCRQCQREVPAGVKEFPFKSIAVTCPLCSEQRQYLPSEVFLGRPNHLVAKQAREGYADMFDPDAAIPRPQRSLIYFGACIIADLRLARERQVNIRVVPTSQAIDESINPAHETICRNSG